MCHFIVLQTFCVIFCFRYFRRRNPQDEKPASYSFKCILSPSPQTPLQSQPSSSCFVSRISESLSWKEMIRCPCALNLFSVHTGALPQCQPPNHAFRHLFISPSPSREGGRRSFSHSPVRATPVIHETEVQILQCHFVLGSPSVMTDDFRAVLCMQCQESWRFRSPSGGSLRAVGFL